MPTRRHIQLTAGVVGAIAALSFVPVAPASAEPSIGELMDSAGRIIQELPIDQNGSGGYDLESLFNPRPAGPGRKGSTAGHADGRAPDVVRPGDPHR